jgi:hypothetical protein
MNQYLNDVAVTILNNEQNQRASILLQEADILDNLTTELSYDPNNEDLQIKVTMQQDRIGSMRTQFGRELAEMQRAAEKEVFGT